MSCVSRATLADARRLVTQPGWQAQVRNDLAGFELSVSGIASARSSRAIGGTFHSRVGHTVRSARRLELAPEKSRRRPAHFRALQGAMERVARFRRRTALGRAPFAGPATGRPGAGRRGRPMRPANCSRRFTTARPRCSFLPLSKVLAGLSPRRRPAAARSSAPIANR